MSNLSTIYPIGNDLIVNSTYAINTSPYTPFALWAAIAIIAGVFFILSFAYKLRGMDGVVSSERVAYSLMAGIVNGLAAWLSLAIAIPSSVAENIVGDQLIIVQNYMVYSQLEIVILFVIFSLIAFANLVYTIMQPEIIKSDAGELTGGQLGDSKVRAEKSRGNDDEDR
jgi:hypothetical protein